MADNQQQFTLKEITKSFGKDKTEDFYDLVNEIKKYDSVIESNLSKNLDNVLQLNKKQFSKLLPFLQDLSRTSNFASSFFIEKIPVLLSFQLYDEVMNLLIKIKDYNARNVSYFLGSSNLESDDLEDILLSVGIEYFRDLIKSVGENHSELKAVSASLLVRAKTINKIVAQKDILLYINISSQIYKQFGFDITDLFIKKTNEILSVIPLNKILPVIMKVGARSHNYLEFFLYNPQININQRGYLKPVKRKQILKCLNKDFSHIFQYVPGILDDKYILSILIHWNSFSDFQKKNMLSQLTKLDYKEYLLTNPTLAKDVAKIKKITKNNWFSFWQYPKLEMDSKYVYSQIKKLIFSGKNFSKSEQIIYEAVKELMSSSANARKDILLNVIRFLEKQAVNKNVKSTLSQLRGLLLNGDVSQEVTALNKGQLVISTWSRDPWVDYSRSDELYACSNIGDFASYNSPGFLADLNVSNLDIWSNGERRGRIYLYLALDDKNKVFILVDRINGSDRLLRHQKQLNFILQTIREYALSAGIDKIVFNSTVSFNSTPKRFIKYVESVVKHEEYLYIKRCVPSGGVHKTLSSTSVSFLESLNKKEAGIMRGFVMKLSNN
ncbi:hypothetical protein A3G67_02250 [Candidatus Roizmanbacteria bacterium RIFCSPLOWO2_12_FULL_40_12]|uniref:Uncharacterized protein n=1 Tax=Candidatus Roizmanbacteria bacterium RIFCSPLOWO2_01_FULL_40_42 TaxID=1802066 RepID=A0A1F7J3S1_9BACT|nr:MAG: hypothetical protein A2779_01455 [Candidatus Roizmanbacteria bacterium RIFCSPHIGHO2_01_FULL_40_98]OGK29026.1 MAG: hypothetical protein A3C31_02095 [Candidatus Roizmanbacteria bacterium RIFCSPHIGHO2_02_FULL_40_53]OGK29977.1 MAG: hypothetical protein A2W49_00115 [Candidatus Roizmanbacteria bacterium RIFCSPHIGHO2_12_41_18]OGK37314.1 MAG: hypothetical protein A3E69_04395 [Candidatus Roizmanbacteria bacterium RIFCSPHIGHO2_12_FULL_40_130]OGK50256.1 MAG: hypothetical protein A3B50_00550 [Candi